MVFSAALVNAKAEYKALERNRVGHEVGRKEKNSRSSRILEDILGWSNLQPDADPRVMVGRGIQNGRSKHSPRPESHTGYWSKTQGRRTLGMFLDEFRRRTPSKVLEEMIEVSLHCFGGKSEPSRVQTTCSDCSDSRAAGRVHFFPCSVSQSENDST